MGRLDAPRPSSFPPASPRRTFAVLGLEPLPFVMELERRGAAAAARAVHVVVLVLDRDLRETLPDAAGQPRALAQVVHERHVHPARRKHATKHHAHGEMRAELEPLDHAERRTGAKDGGARASSART